MSDLVMLCTKLPYDMQKIIYGNYLNLDIFVFLEKMRDRIDRSCSFEEVEQILRDNLPFILGKKRYLEYFLSDSEFAKLYYSIRCIPRNQFKHHVCCCYGICNSCYCSKTNGIHFANQMICINSDLSGSIRPDQICLWRATNYFPWVENRKIYKSIGFSHEGMFSV